MANEAMVDFNKEDRTVIVHDNINEQSTSLTNKYLLQLIRDDEKESDTKKNYVVKPIHFYINSNGGNVFDMWSTISIILASKTPIYTYCTGYAFSAGFLLFLAGKKRYIGKYAQLMYHQLSSGTYGKVNSILEDVTNFIVQQEHIEQYVTSRTKFSKKELEENRELKKDKWISADEAIKYGCATDFC